MLKNSKKIKKNLQRNKSRLIFLSSIIILFLVINLVMLATTKTSLLTMIVNRLMDSNTKYTDEIKSITIESDDYDEPGSWHIEKSAEWTGAGKAKVTFDVDTIAKTEDHNMDVILVIDISASMSGNKLKKAKEDAIELVEVLLSNKNNKVALITFDTISTVVSEFTNNQEDIISKINSLTASGNTNYNHALQNVDKVMEGYLKEEDRDVVTLFLTDGFPNVDTPNQIGTYGVLKEKYPYMTINGIQYEMGKVIIEEIKEISDRQWAADQNTLSNVLFEASISPISYEKYEIVDYIDNDYFILDKKEGIDVSTGTVKVEEENGYEKVIWTLDPFATGKAATMNINLLLKDEYKEKGGYYSTNEREEINYNLFGEEEQNVESDKTPVLKNQYDVIYDTNPPSGCELEEIQTETYFVYDNVVKKQNKLTCKGYNFKGWEVVEEDVKQVNDDVFVMPAHDVTVRATWSKPSIDKSMDGMVIQLPKLYDVVEDEALNGTQAKLYTYSVDDDFKEKSDKSVYYYTGNNVTKNNVIFAGYCWKIVRTTTTGGVKILYNGVSTDDGKCIATGQEATIGDSSFNSNSDSLAYVGYMYNKIHIMKGDNSEPDGLKIGGGAKYQDGQYTLIDLITSTKPNFGYRYACIPDSSNTCDTVRFYYEYTSWSQYNNYYVELDGAENIADALDQMLHADNVNETDSTIKKVIDKWYEENLIEYKNQLEDTIFCNNRFIYEYGGWHQYIGSIEGTASWLKFDGFLGGSSLGCANNVDKFSIQNSLARLDYPIGLLSNSEATLIGNSARNIEYNYWLGSPSFARDNYVTERTVYNTGNLGNANVSDSRGVRPVVSLKPNTVYSDGDGSTENPFVVVIR